MDTDESFELVVRTETEKLLRTADLNTTTERGIVEQLQKILGRPVTPCKHIIKETIERFLDSLGDDEADERQTTGGAASGSEGAAEGDAEEQQAAKAGAKRGSAAGAAAAKGSKKARGSGSGSEVDAGPLWATELGGRKRASVRRYQGKLLVDVREYYTDKADGVEKPGAKGLAVDADQWPPLAEALPRLLQRQQDKQKSSEGDGMLELGRTRGGIKRVSVSEFRGVYYVDLREFYEKDGQVLPGKKGISLDATAAQALAAAVPQVTAVLEGRTPPPPAAPASAPAAASSHARTGGEAAAGKAPAARATAGASNAAAAAEAVSTEHRAGPSAGSAPSTDAAAGASAAATAAAASWVDLGGSKRLSISRFAGRVFVDLREYYEQAGEFKPGKKGISLDLPSWKTVCQHLDHITAAAQRKDMSYLLEIGNKRRVSLSEFKGTTYIGVREFYEKDGAMLPGAKGLAMTSEQWAACAKGAAAINAQLQKDGLL